VFQVTASAESVAPPQAIWDLLEDPHNYEELVPVTDRVLEAPAGGLHVGYEYREHGGIPPFKADSTWTVTEYKPNTRQVHVGDDGTMTMNLSIDITPTDGGCRLVQQLELTPRWYMVVPAWVMWHLLLRKRAQEAMQQTVENISRTAETA